MNRQQAELIVRSVPRTCRGPLSEDARRVKDALLADGRLEDAAAEDAAGRAGCGYDVNDIICAAPFDGGPREADCPGCGTLIRFTPPFFELED